MWRSWVAQQFVAVFVAIPVPLNGRLDVGLGEQSDQFGARGAMVASEFLDPRGDRDGDRGSECNAW